MIFLILLGFGLMSAISIDVMRFARDRYRSKSAWISERQAGRPARPGLVARFRGTRG